MWRPPLGYGKVDLPKANITWSLVLAENLTQDMSKEYHLYHGPLNGLWIIIENPYFVGKMYAKDTIASAKGNHAIYARVNLD